MENEETQKYKIVKWKCDICGKTIKKVMSPKDDPNEIFRKNFYKYEKDGKVSNVCFNCEDRYHIIQDYCNRGYGYHIGLARNKTALDKNSTPVYGIELEVAGNIKCIDKISKIAGHKSDWAEVSIGYDTSVAGAQFELSYAPGTYFWYLHESKLKAICQLLQKDNWVVDSPSAGMHIHTSNYDAKKMMKGLIHESYVNPVFWDIIRIFGERQLNQYCAPHFRANHHDAISVSRRWNTIEFRIFKMTLDFDKIMNRIKFIRQIINNTDEIGVHWNQFSPEAKAYFLQILHQHRGIRKETKMEIEYVFEHGWKPEWTETYVSPSPEEAIAVERTLNAIMGYSNEEYYDENEEQEQEEQW